jgi:hypothetical protein
MAWTADLGGQLRHAEIHSVFKNFHRGENRVGGNQGWHALRKVEYEDDHTDDD